MLLNYLKLAIRLLLRNPFFAIINIFGLAIGFASFFALWQYSTAELKMDQYHKDFDRIVRVGLNWRWTDDGGENWGLMVFGISKSKLPPILMEDYPEIESYVRFLGQGGFFQGDIAPHSPKILISTNNPTGQKRIFKETNITYADSNFFEFFTIPILSGDKRNIISEANHVALSHSTARKYFGERNPQGEVLLLNDSITLMVTGVYEDLPHNTHLVNGIQLSPRSSFPASINRLTCPAFNRSVPAFHPYRNRPSASRSNSDSSPRNFVPERRQVYAS
jgi:putative ABC transport system permease protein